MYEQGYVDDDPEFYDLILEINSVDYGDIEPVLVVGCERKVLWRVIACCCYELCLINRREKEYISDGLKALFLRLNETTEADLDEAFGPGGNRFGSLPGWSPEDISFFSDLETDKILQFYELLSEFLSMTSDWTSLGFDEESSLRAKETLEFLSRYIP